MAMAEWMSASLRSRGVLRIAGPDCLKFLQVVPHLQPGPVMVCHLHMMHCAINNGSTAICTLQCGNLLLGCTAGLNLTSHWLQGLITNDISRLQSDEAAPLYTAMLNNKGRQLYEMTIHHDPSVSNAVLLDCPADAADRLKKVLHRFKLRTQVSIDDASEDYSVACAWQSSGSSQHGTGENKWLHDTAVTSDSASSR